MLLWMTLSLLFCTRAYGRSISLLRFSTPFCNQRNPYAFVPPIASKAHLPSRPTTSSTRLFGRGGGSSKMRGVKKENLPSKVCVVCDRPFTWRKKWERCWDEVTTCSKSCNSKRKGRKTSLDHVTKDGKIISHGKLNASDEKDRAISMLEANFVDVNIDGASVTNNFKERELEDLFENIAPDTHLNSGISNENDYQTMTYQNTKINESEDEYEEDQYSDSKARRKAEKKRMKAERRAQREGKGNPTAGQKQCTICSKSVDLLIRCQYDVTEQWGMVCGKCWNDVSGGVVDGDAAHPYYRYGGLWKNRRAQKA